jgi:hypothetical protein
MKQLPMVVLDHEPKGKKKPIRTITLVNHKKATHDYILGIASIYGCRTADVLDDLVEHAKKHGLESVHGRTEAKAG